MQIPPKPRPNQAPCFRYVQTPPHIPSDPRYADQRYFSRRADNAVFYLGYGKNQTFRSCLVSVRLYRHAQNNHAELKLEIQTGADYQSNMRVNMTASELRHVASLMLDAAHDLETNSAASLAMRAAA